VVHKIVRYTEPFWRIDQQRDWRRELRQQYRASNDMR